MSQKRPDGRPVNTEAARPSPVSLLRDIAAYWKQEKKWTYFFLAFYLCAGILINYCYPYMDGTSDTGGYIRWAMEDLYGGTRPLGYSHFMSFVHDIGYSSGTLFVVQLLIYALATIVSFYTVLYVFDIRKSQLKTAVFLVSIGFVTGLYTTNVSMSDSLFYSLGLLMICACLLFARRPSVAVFIAVLLLILYSIKIRYLGLSYPLPVIVLVMFCVRKNLLRAIAVAALVAIPFAYVNYVQDKTEEDQGVRIFSAFGGWQMSSNALHVVPHLDLKEPLVTSDDKDIMFVDTFVRLSYPMFRSKYPGPGEVSYAFIWIDSLPLRPAFYAWRAGHPWMQYYPAWNQMGDIYNRYGSLLAKTYPGLFFRYYLWNNSLRAVLPPSEIYDNFIITGSPGNYERSWFHWDEKEQIVPRHDIFRPLLLVQRYCYPLLWLIFLVSAIYLSANARRLLRRHPVLFRSALFLMLFIVIYVLMSIFAAPINLRFMLLMRTAILMLAAVAVQYRIVQQPEPDNKA